MKKLHIIITCSIIISCLILLVNAKDIMHNQTTIENATITEMLTSWEYWTCDFDKDWLTTAADVMIFQNECNLEDWRQSEICDLNNDWKFNSVDITVYNDSCYWKLLWYESNTQVTNECDFDNDKNNVTSADITRFYEHCDLVNWRDSKKCDLDKDWKFTAADITKFNDICYGKLLWTELNENNKWFTITKTSEKNVILSNKNIALWEFIIKSKTNKNMDLNSITLRNWDEFSCNDVSLVIDNVKVNNCTSRVWDLTYKMNKTINWKWTSVQIFLNKEHRWTYMIWLLSINDYKKYENNVSIPFETFTKRYENTLVNIKNQKNSWSETIYTLWIKESTEKTKYSAYNVSLFTTNDCVGSPVNNEPQKSMWEWGREYSDWEIIKATNLKSSQTINSISYIDKEWGYVCITKSEFPSHFTVNWEPRKVYPYSSPAVEKKEIVNKWYSIEMEDAYKFAYKNWITTVNNIDKAKMYSPLTRIAMAKMLSNYAINVLWKNPDFSKWTPFFNDVTDKLNKQYDNAVTLSYQLWIMWINMKNNNFRPYDEVTRAEFATALSRMLYNIEDGRWNVKYYEPHITKLYNEWIITNKNGKMKEKRWYVMTMLMRTVE